MDVLVVGGGEEGVAVLELLVGMEGVRVSGAVVVDSDDPAAARACERGIPTAMTWQQFLHEHIDLVVDVTGDPSNEERLKRDLPPGSALLSGAAVRLFGKAALEWKHLKNAFLIQEKHVVILNEALLNLGADLKKNIDLLTSICGRLLGASCVFYNRLDGQEFETASRWNVPSEFQDRFMAKGTICGDVVRRAMREGVQIVRHLKETPYAEVAPAIRRYESYAGHPVCAYGRNLGVLCAFFDLEVDISDEDRKLIGIIAVAIGIEEERRQMEEALRRGAGDLERAQAVAHIGSWRFDARRNEFLWSSEVFRIFGLPEGGPCSYATFLAYVHPDDRAEVDRAWMMAFKEGTPYEIEHRILVGDRVKWVRGRAELEIDEKGNVLCSIGTIQDITEQHVAEERVAELKVFYEGILETIVTGVWVTDERDVLSFFNAAMERIFGVSSAQLIGKRMLEDIDEGTIQHFRPLYLKAKRTREPVPYEMIPVITPTGRKRLQSGWIVPIVRAGAYVGMICTMEDVTAHARAQALLQESEERFRDVANNAGEWIWEVDAEGCYTFSNVAVGVILGYAPSELVGQCHYPDFVDADDREQVKARVDAAIAQGTPLAKCIAHLRHRDRRIVIVEMSGVPMFDDRGGCIGFRGASLDITQRVQVEEILRAKMAEIERLNHFMIGREMRVIEMKREVNALLEAAGRETKYAIM